MSENPAVERCIEHVLELRLRHAGHLRNVIFVFPRVRFADETGWSSHVNIGLLGAIQGIDPSELAEHSLFIPINGAVELEVSVSGADARRLAQYGVLAIQRKKGAFGVHVSPQGLAWFVPGICEEEGVSSLGEQMAAVMSARVPWFITRGLSAESPLLGILNDASYSSPQARKDIRRALWFVQDGKCAGCGNPIPTLGEATLDHSLPRQAHGTDTKANFSVMCQRCNQEKGNQLPPDLSPEDARLAAYSLERGLWRPGVSASGRKK